jgi:pimeloyl-ACP methyl ester carboxylesterase
MMRATALALATAAALSFCMALPVAAFDTPPVKVVLDGRMTVKGPGGEGELPLATSQDWSHRLPNVTRVVIVVHGAHRNADSIFRSAVSLVPDGSTLVIAPQFLLDEDIAAHSLAENVLRWRPDGWEIGADAIAPVPVSSYDTIDTLLDNLADRSRLPNLQTVVLAGFSGGGWLAQRYAAVGHGGQALTQRGVALRYVVSSPSSYVYFSADRPAPGGGFGPFAGAASCPDYNLWPYGLAGNVPRYVAAAAAGGAEAVERRYAGLTLAYLVGGTDNDPNHWELDKSCCGEAEGPDRLARATNFYAYMKARDPAILKQSFATAAGAGHDEKSVFGSPCGLALLFGEQNCPELERR